MLNWTNEKLETKEIKDFGKGVFAKKDIKKDELLCVFGGYIIPVKGEPENSDYDLQIAEDLLISSQGDHDGGSFFNSSCEPNAGFKGQIFLVAMRNIKRGEQICFDYAMVLSHSKGAKKYKIKCHCGSKNCRGYITENDWKIPELQKKYSGYFQWYLQEKINRFKQKKKKIL